MKRRRGLLLTVGILLTVLLWLHVQEQQYALDRQLIDAMIQHDTKTAIVLLNAGADPNARAKPTPAVSLTFLLDHLLHRTDSVVIQSPTAFMLACGTWWLPAINSPFAPPPLPENLPLLQAMLAHGANVHDRTAYGLTALHFAVRANRERTVELLLQQGAEVNAPDQWHHTPLTMASWIATANIAHLLLAHGAKLDAQDADGNTPLYWAVTLPNAPKLLPELLAHGADPNRHNKSGLTPLLYAQQMGRRDLVALMRRGGK